MEHAHIDESCGVSFQLLKESEWRMLFSMFLSPEDISIFMCRLLYSRGEEYSVPFIRKNQKLLTNDELIRNLMTEQTEDYENRCALESRLLRWLSFEKEHSHDWINGQIECEWEESGKNKSKSGTDGMYSSQMRASNLFIRYSWCNENTWLRSC